MKYHRSLKHIVTLIISLLLASGAALQATSIPPEAPGQTLVWRETFAPPVIDPANPGTLTAVESGTMRGGLPNGPVWMEDGAEASWSGAIRNRTAEEMKQTATIFDGFRELPQELADRGLVAMWLRPSSRQNIRPGGFFQLEGNQGEQLRGLAGVSMATLPDDKLVLAMDGKVVLEQMRAPETPIDGGQIVPLDEWVLLWFAYDREEGIELWMQTGPDTEPVLVSRHDLSGAGAAFEQVRLRSSGTANQGGFAGRIGPLSVYQIDSLEAGRKAPGGMAWPDNAVTTWTVSPEESAHDLAKQKIGGWERLASAIHENVVLGRVNQAWVDREGASAGYATLPDVATKRQWWLDWVDGKYLPAGDRVEFEPGVYRGSGLPGGNHGGIHYTLIEGAPDYSVDIRGSRPMIETWSQPSPESHPRVWKYDGEPHPNRHVWGKDWQSFNVFFTTEGKDAAVAALDGRPWAAYTDPDGVTFISLPDGVTPQSIGPLEGSSSGGFNWTGSWLGRLLIQGTAAYKHSEPGSDRALGAYALHVNSGPAITVIEGRGWRCAKHPAGFVGTDPRGLCIWHKTDVGYDPPAPGEGDPAGFGVGTGAFTPLVDYNSALTSEENPGKIVSIYDGVTYQNPTEPGDGTTNAKPARRGMYFTHGSGTKNSHMFALTVVRNPWPTMFHVDPEIDNFPEKPPSSHVAFEVIPSEDSNP